MILSVEFYAFCHSLFGLLIGIVLYKKKSAAARPFYFAEYSLVELTKWLFLLFF
jgi:hypothetical protein